MGAFWWQQSLWKLPPFYTDHPEAPFGETGLAYWMGLLGKHAAIPLQADFVNHVVLPHFYWFAPLVYLLELLTGVSLMFGAFVRAFAIVGALQILNIWLGLYSAPGEWPWTYFFCSCSRSCSPSTVTGAALASMPCSMRDVAAGIGPGWWAASSPLRHRARA